MITGDNALSLLGFLLIFVGIVALAAGGPAVGWEDEPLVAASRPNGSPFPGSSQSGGAVLVGPFPIFFGSFRGRGRRWLALCGGIGLALIALAVAAVLVLAS